MRSITSLPLRMKWPVDKDLRERVRAQYMGPTPTAHRGQASRGNDAGGGPSSGPDRFRGDGRRKRPTSIAVDFPWWKA